MKRFQGDFSNANNQIKLEMKFLNVPKIFSIKLKFLVRKIKIYHNLFASLITSQSLYKNKFLGWRTQQAHVNF